jgi:hypothetical protein
MNSMRNETQLIKIMNPLKFIKQRAGSWVNHPKKGKIWEPNDLYEVASNAAKRGNGLLVNKIAFSLRNQNKF